MHRYQRGVTTESPQNDEQPSRTSLRITLGRHARQVGIRTSDQRSQSVHNCRVASSEQRHSASFGSRKSEQRSVCAFEKKSCAYHSRTRIVTWNIGNGEPYTLMQWFQDILHPFLQRQQVLQVLIRRQRQRQNRKRERNRDACDDLHVLLNYSEQS